MEINLLRATTDDAETIWKMQKTAFAGLLEKYRDFDTNPTNESLERVTEKLRQDSTYFYLIRMQNKTVGAIRVVDCGDDTRKRVSPLFVLPQFRNLGIAQQAMQCAEQLHGAQNWELSTILQEKGNCRLYEKMGYRQTGKTQIINDKMTLVFYEK